jgi:hypothetical protein
VIPTGRERKTAIVCGADAVGSVVDVPAAARGNKELVRIVSVERVDGFVGLCEGIEEESGFRDDFHSVAFAVAFLSEPNGFVSDIAWMTSAQDPQETVIAVDRTNGWVLVRGFAAPSPQGTSFLRTLQESFSPVAAPAKPLRMKARVFALVATD